VVRLSHRRYPPVRRRPPADRPNSRGKSSWNGPGHRDPRRNASRVPRPPVAPSVVGKERRAQVRRMRLPSRRALYRWSLISNLAIVAAGAYLASVTAGALLLAAGILLLVCGAVGIAQSVRDLRR
jgi:hypothetical protein